MLCEGVRGDEVTVGLVVEMTRHTCAPLVVHVVPGKWNSF